MKRKPGARPPGQIRRSQLITSFGPGAMVDLPNHSVLIGGLDSWSKGGDEIVEPRLAAKLAQLLGVSSIQLRSPPPDQEDSTLPQTGITAFLFPEWFITQDVESAKPGSNVRSRLLVHRRELVKGKYIDHDRKKKSVVPIRFVRACPAGHIGDIAWYEFAHNGPTDCRRQLWIDERGTSGDLTEVSIRCECGRAERSLAQAAILANRSLGHCDGCRPWLGSWAKEPCGQPNRLLIRTASNAYFSQKMTVISLPDRDETVKQAVDAAWAFIEAVETLEDLQYERRKARVKAALEGLGDDEVFAEIQSRRGGQPRKEKSVKLAELVTLIASKEEIGEDRIDGTFLARSLPREAWDQPWMQPIERVILVHRLREVVAQVGFTRFEAATPDTNGELGMGVQRASLSREAAWLPAIENRGEGVFLLFRKEAVETWAAQPDVQKRGQSLIAGFESWRLEHQESHREFPGLRYLMLHSFAHLLITAVSLECGYPASSIRERIYCIPEVGYGVMLYTGSPDAEGTLGALVQVGRRIHEHVRSALEMGELCSNDPVCAQHEPPNAHEHRYLHGAACHGCLLIAETSCEQQNEFLDRALVVPTVDRAAIEFFRLNRP